MHTFMFGLRVGAQNEHSARRGWPVERGEQWARCRFRAFPNDYLVYRQL